MRKGFHIILLLPVIQGMCLCTPAVSLSQSVKLSWRPNPEPDIKYYTIYRATSSNPSTEIARVSATNTTFIDEDIALGNDYYYRISAADSAGNLSEFSDEMVIITDIPTPVELQSFSGQFTDNKVILKWITATETNNYGFEIERGQRNDLFEKIGFVEGKGTVTTPNVYTYVDEDVSAGRYFYRLKQLDVDGDFEFTNTVTINVGIPERFELSANYPNPFNPETTFNYNVAKDINVSLTVYDILGRKVKTLVDGPKRSGRYSITWDGTDNFSRKVASGAYFARFVAGNFSQMRNILLQK